jgi:hypothetical protein
MTEVMLALFWWMLCRAFPCRYFYFLPAKACPFFLSIDFPIHACNKLGPIIYKSQNPLLYYS